MNIHKYYQYAAMSSLHGSIAALIPPIVLVCIGMVLKLNLSILLLSIPFMFYSFISYQIFLVNKHRHEEKREPMMGTQEETKDVSHSVAIQFLPAPSLRMLLFHSNGQLHGEITDRYCYKFRWFLPYFLDQMISNSYVFNEPGGKESFIFIMKGKNRVLVKGSGSDQYLASIQKNSLKHFHIVSEKGTKEISLHSSSLFTDMKFYDSDGYLLARMRRGYLPRQWDKHFKDANTPILSFNENISSTEKIMFLAILTMIFRYRDH